MGDFSSGSSININRNGIFSAGDIFLGKKKNAFFGNSSTSNLYGNTTYFTENIETDVFTFGNNSSSNFGNSSSSAASNIVEDYISNLSGVISGLPATAGGAALASAPSTLQSLISVHSIEHPNYGNSSYIGFNFSGVADEVAGMGMGINAHDVMKVFKENDQIVVTLDNGSILMLDENTHNIRKFVTASATFFYDENGLIIGSEPPSSIFGDVNSMYGQYGGSQNDFFNNQDAIRHDENVLRIINERFGDVSEDAIDNYLSAISSCGCHFTAVINTVINSYRGREQEFLDTFGFPMYTVDKNGVVDYNYEALITDIHSYYWTHDFTTIDEYGNYVWGHQGYGDIYSVASHAYEDGINDSGANVCLEYLRDRYNVDFNGMQTISDHIISEAEFNSLVSEGNQLIINTNGYDLVCMDGTYAQGNYQNYGHAMTVTGWTTDGWGNRVMTVSDRGIEYMIYPHDIGYGNFVYFDVINLAM